MSSTFRHMLVVAVAVASVFLSACGGPGSEDGELVSIKTHLDLDFRLDPDDGPEHVFSIGTELVLDRNGRGTYTTDDEVRELEASPEQIDEIDEAFADMDLDRLAEGFDAETDEVGSFTVTYDGRTTEIGADVVDDDTGSEGAEQFLTATLLLGALSETGDSPAGSQVERETEELAECLEAKPPPDCLNEVMQRVSP